jgi:hypothetical protein
MGQRGIAEVAVRKTNGEKVSTIGNRCPAASLITGRQWLFAAQKRLVQDDNFGVAISPGLTRERIRARDEEETR